MNYTFQSGGLWFYFLWRMDSNSQSLDSTSQQGRDKLYFLAKNKLIIISENELDFPVLMGVFYF